MSQVASLELCRELYEMSIWETGRWYRLGGVNPNRDVPKYDAGFLLRKLLPEYGKITLTHDFGHKQWWATDVVGHAVFEADTPENALCKLAIQLFNAGVLTKGGGDE